MKITSLLPILSVGAASLAASALVGCKAGGKRTTSHEQLPASCTLLAMSADERSAHERRLELLRKSARLEQETSDGFEFAVDLRQMPARDLELWMINEQKCCSFLKMRRALDEAGTLANIYVECPPDLRVQVMQTFGFEGSAKRPKG